MTASLLTLAKRKRDLKSRLDKRKWAIKFQKPEKSALCEHFITMDHRIDWNRATKYKTEKDNIQRFFAESRHINKNLHVMNRNVVKSYPLCKKNC